jgi:hypothetical protein
MRPPPPTSTTWKASWASGATGIAADLIVRDTLPADFWLIDGTEVANS